MLFLAITGSNPLYTPFAIMTIGFVAVNAFQVMGDLVCKSS
jgi:hypothetical protein